MIVEICYYSGRVILMLALLSRLLGRVYKVGVAVFGSSTPCLNILRLVSQDFGDVRNITGTIKRQHYMDIRIYQVAVCVSLLVMDDHGIFFRPDLLLDNIFKSCQVFDR